MPVSLSGSLLITGSLTVTEGIIMSGSIASASYAVSSSNAFLATNVVGTANRILFNSATNTTTTSNNLTWENSINLMALGDTTGTAGTISKIALYTSSFGGYGLGVSPAQLDYVSDGSHVFYKNGVTPTELVRIANNGDVNISSSLNVTNGITGNLTGTSSYATNANLLDGLDSTVFTSTASFTAQTASFTAFTSSLNTFSASILSYTSSINAKTSSFATTSSNTFIGTQTITGSLLQSGNYTTTGTITAQTINVQQVTSSIVYSCGSNNFGTAIGNTQVFTGSMFITGSTLTVNGGAICTENTFNGSTWIKVSNGSNGSGAAAGLLLANDGGDLGAISLLSSGNSPANALFIRSLSTNPLVFGTGNTPQMRLDASGNLGLGVTPSAWRNIFNAFQVGYTGTLYAIATSTASEQVNLASNYYQDSAGNELRIQAGFATRYQQASGEHRWSTAGTSSAGSGISFTQAMTLNASGNLGIGTTNPTSKLTINASSDDATGTQSVYISGAKSGFAGFSGLWQNQLFVYDCSATAAGVGGAISFGGNAGGGQTTWFGSLEGIKENATSGDYGGALVFRTRTNGCPTPAEKIRITSDGYVAVTGNQGLKCVPYLQGMSFGWNRTNGQGESMINWTNAGGGTACDLTFNFRDSSTLYERMRLNSSGNLGLGVTPSAWMSGSTALQVVRGGLWHDGSGYLAMFNNAYYDGSNWRYIASTTATVYNQVNGANQWSIATSGTAGCTISFTQAMTLNAGGNLGIGTTNPGYKLDICREGSGITGRFGKETIFGEWYVDGQRVGLQGTRSSDSAVSGFYIENPTNTGTSNFELLSFKTIGSEKMRITNCGYVGMLQTSPDTTLDIGNTTNQAAWSSCTSCDANLGENFENNIIIQAQHAPGANAAYGYPTSNLVFRTSNASNDIWNVGAIQGVVDPFGGSYYQGGLVFLTRPASNDCNPIGRKTQGGPLVPILSLGQNSCNCRIAFFNSNVGIGTASPSQKLEVVGGEIKAGRVDSSNEGGQISFGRASDNATGYYIDAFGSTSTPDLRFVDVSNSSVRMTLSNQGSLWINSTTASPTLNSYIYQYNGDGSRINAMFEVSVATPGFTSLAFRNPNGIVGSVAINENTVTYGGTSDYRLKEDLRDFDGLNKVAAIKVYDFKWKTSEERNEGVLAHELESIVPYAVTGEKDAVFEDGSIKSQMVDYSKLVPVLIKAIQEQQCTICSQASTINTLKTCLGII